jgi:uncharacterized cupin superfamily protein
MKRALMLVALLLATEMSGFAQQPPKIVRFEPNGPGGRGLTGNDRDSSKIHYYYKSKADERVAAGIWSSPDFGGRMRRVTNTEFIYILEGAVTLLDTSGREETFKAGDAAAVESFVGAIEIRSQRQPLISIRRGIAGSRGQGSEQKIRRSGGQEALFFTIRSFCLEPVASQRMFDPRPLRKDL